MRPVASSPPRPGSENGGQLLASGPPQHLPVRARRAVHAKARGRHGCCRSLRHPVYAALLHFGLETAANFGPPLTHATSGVIFGGCGLDRAWRSAEVCQPEIDGEVWPGCNFKPLVFSQFRTAVDTDTEISRCIQRCPRAPWSSSIGTDSRHASEPVVFFIGMPSPGDSTLSSCESSTSGALGGVAVFR
jgi:hypothetical protein